MTPTALEASVFWDGFIATRLRHFLLSLGKLWDFLLQDEPVHLPPSLVPGGGGGCVTSVGSCRELPGRGEGREGVSTAGEVLTWSHAGPGLRALSPVHHALLGAPSGSSKRASLSVSGDVGEGSARPAHPDFGPTGQGRAVRRPSVPGAAKRPCGLAAGFMQKPRLSLRARPDAAGPPIPHVLPGLLQPCKARRRPASHTGRANPPVCY